MKLVVQRVLDATLKINNNITAQIKNGLVCFIGFTEGDQNKDYTKAISKLTGLRVFEYYDGKMNLNLSQINGELLIIPNFTLYADCSHGFRPSFINALNPTDAKPCFEKFVNLTKQTFTNTFCGVFGADMKITQTNDGPITIVMEF